MSDRLFDLDEVPEVPLFREPRRARGAQVMDARLDNDYPPEWSKCFGCEGRGTVPDPAWIREQSSVYAIILNRDDCPDLKCPDCLGMGSVKARVRLEAGHRCVRCKHPFMTKGDAKMLGVEPSPGRWSPCDARCTHGGPIRHRQPGETEWHYVEKDPADGAYQLAARSGVLVEAEWKVLTVHHCNGDKGCLAWWNLIALCQVCHLTVQAKIVLERVYPFEHADWFKVYAAGWYAYCYEKREITRAEAEERMEELLAYEHVV